MPYIKNVESRDSEAGEAGRPKGNPPIVATYSHSWKRSSAPVVKSSGEVSLHYKTGSLPVLIQFLPPFYKMIEYNQKQSKEIYKALADSKIDLMEYFLGPDPKKTSYYKNAVRKRSLLNDF